MKVEFKSWMLAQHFADYIYITVTHEQIHTIMRVQVCGRNRNNDSSIVVSYYTVRQYETACIDLYKQQKSWNMNANPHPRDSPAVNVLFNSVRLDESKECQKEF